MVKAAGIDLSLTETGVAHSNGHIEVFGHKNITTMAWLTQLALLGELRREITACVWSEKPTIVVIEGLDMARSYGGQIQRCYLWCSVVDDLLRSGVAVYVAPSPQVKMYATGSGYLPRGQEKTAVIEAVTTQWPHMQIGRNNNKADAAAMCALALEIAGDPFTEVTPAQRRAVQSTLSAYVDPPQKKRKT